MSDFAILRTAVFFTFSRHTFDITAKGVPLEARLA